GLTQKAAVSAPGVIINTEEAPWHRLPDGSRRAAAAGSGFGGINYHVMLEHRDQYDVPKDTRFVTHEPIAIVAVSALLPDGVATPDDLTQKLAANSLPEPESLAEGPSRWLPETSSRRPIRRMPDYPFNPGTHKVLPLAVSQIDPGQLLGLK